MRLIRLMVVEDPHVLEDECLDRGVIIAMSLGLISVAEDLDDFEHI